MAMDLREEGARCQIPIFLTGKDVPTRPMRDVPTAGGGVGDLGIRRRWAGDGRTPLAEHRQHGQS